MVCPVLLISSLPNFSAAAEEIELCRSFRGNLACQCQRFIDSNNANRALRSDDYTKL